MEEAEKMVALKKAYADIILNTAKEAAARVMASERKALRFQQDLCSTKDEALRMLLRVKQMIDSQTNEAEIKFSSQRRRIHELEAQLDEAEGTILDLRTELKQAQDQLDKVNNSHMQPLNGTIENQDGPCHGSTMHENLTNPDPIISSPSNSGPKSVTISEVKGTPWNQRILDNKCCNSTEQNALSKSHLKNLCVGNSDIASIIMRSKEPELYRNGCTQRIRAFERNLLDEKLPPPGDVDDQHFVLKTEPIVNVNEQNIGIITVPSPKTENMDITKNPSGLEAVCVNSRTYVKVRKIRRRKTRYGKAKAKATSCRFGPSQPMKPRQPSSVLSLCKTNPYIENDNVKSGEGACTLPCAKAENMNLMEDSSGLEGKVQHNKDQALRVVRRSLRKRKIKYRDASATSCRSIPDQLTEPCQPCLFLSRCKTFSVNCNVKSGEDRPNTENEAKIETAVGPILESTKVNVCTMAVRESGHTENATDNDRELVDEVVLVKRDSNAAESPRVPSCKLNLEMDRAPLMDSDSNDAKTSEASNRAPSQADNNRILKYTFSRKRKKESLPNPDENAALGKSTTKRRVVEKQNGAPEPEKSSLINESSRDSRRLVQVARQLISLSGKRW